MTSYVRTLLFAAAVALPVAWSWEDLVLPPLEGKSGSEAALFFAQGAGISTSLYQELGAAIQAAAPFPLWFASPQCLSDACAVPGTLANGMTRVKATMANDYAFNASETVVFYGGHSLGGLRDSEGIGTRAEYLTLRVVDTTWA